ncbi:hypothetical protein L207DRAFT_175578 [Hyaloscypha variabilis F]|uniref:Uncharacterized protein n=1 Tax=Hyaloscypha variabilis (strain UAMH 11265 / GT02V1 / F) TaxID=1149755 RepID=A0A2J6R3M5_HYAVF|nr:hypothetical protein L207DRAFT_175578 [Hyaloscypha variabilis F]
MGPGRPHCASRARPPTGRRASRASALPAKTLSPAIAAMKHGTEHLSRSQHKPHTTFGCVAQLPDPRSHLQPALAQGDAMDGPGSSVPTESASRSVRHVWTGRGNFFSSIWRVGECVNSGKGALERP